MKTSAVRLLVIASLLVTLTLTSCAPYGPGYGGQWGGYGSPTRADATVGGALLGAAAVTPSFAQDSVYVPLLTYRTGPFASSGIPIAVLSSAIALSSSVAVCAAWPAVHTDSVFPSGPSPGVAAKLSLGPVALIR